MKSARRTTATAVVLATAGNNLDKTLAGEFIDAIVTILRAHPNAIYLLIGDAELAWQKRKFESAGVGKRVGFAGKRKDLPGFLRIADLYLAEFPTASAFGVLQAMSVERPVVAAKCGDDAETSQASGSPACAGPGDRHGPFGSASVRERARALLLVGMTPERDELGGPGPAGIGQPVLERGPQRALRRGHCRG